MSRLSSFALPVAGLFLLAGGFVYDVLFAGIPYQDPPPELAAKYALHSSIASLISNAGLAVLAIGIVLLVVRKLRRPKTGRGTPDSA